MVTEKLSNVLPGFDAALAAVAKRLRQSVVVVRSGGHGIGSGIVWSAGGLVVTNHHVVHRVGNVEVVLSDGRLLSARVVAYDPHADLAALRVSADPARADLGAPRVATHDPRAGLVAPRASNDRVPARAPEVPATPEPATLREVRAGLVPALVRDSAELRIGEIVLAVGNPLGLRGAVTAGIVSGLGPVRLGSELRALVQADVALLPGNSGGPLADVAGRVVGVNSMVVAPGLALAVPSAVVSRFVSQLPSERDERDYWQ